MTDVPRYTWRESTAALRKVLRNYRSLLASSADDVDAAVTLFDLGQILDDERVLTPRQREAIRLNLLDERSAADTAIAMGITSNSLYELLRAGLRRLLVYLQTQKLPSNVPWSRAEIDTLIDSHAEKATDVAKKLGRSVPAVYQMRSALKKRGLLSPTPKRGRPLSGHERGAREVARVSGANATAASYSEGAGVSVRATSC